VVERVNTLNPNVIALTGDIADGYAAQLAGETAPLPVFAPAMAPIW
jgi:hypothetical protein